MALKTTGKLIVFEGIDGAGKTTQASKLCETLELKGHHALVTKEPTPGPFGQKIREIAKQGRWGKLADYEPQLFLSMPGILTSEQQRTITIEDEHRLFLSDRKEHVKNLLKPSLKDGKIIICDRYYFSNMAYQGALGLSPEKIKVDNEKIAPHPDIIFLLEIDPPEGINRIRVSRKDITNLGYEQEEYLWKVKKIFDQIQDPALVRLDARQGIEALHQEILRLVEERLGLQ